MPDSPDLPPSVRGKPDYVRLNRELGDFLEGRGAREKVYVKDGVKFVHKYLCARGHLHRWLWRAKVCNLWERIRK